jgi:hypothetical protein
MRPVRVAGLGGSLRELSTSRTALQVALEGAAASGADGTCDYAEGTGIGPASHHPAPLPGAYPGTVNDRSSA